MNEVKNIPILRFPEFNEVWNQFKLKDVSKYSNGGSFENDVNEHGRYELVTLKSINTEGNLVSSGRYIDKDVKTLQEGTLVMILSEQAPGLLGMTAIIPCDNKYVLNQRVAEIRPTNEINSFFLSSVINVNQRYFSKHGAGMKVQNISKPNVEKFEFYIPSLYEQQKIGDFLTLVDKRIDLLKKKKTLLETYKKGVMKKIFKQEIRFKDENGKEFPDWVENRLGNVATLKNGYSFKSSSYSKNGIYSILTISNVQEGKLLVNECKKVEKIPSDISKHQILEFEDLLISMTGNVGRVAKVNHNGCLLNQRVGKIVPFSISLNYLFQVLNTNTFRNKMISNSQGGAQPNLSKSDIENYSFNCPSKEEQEKISNFLSSIDNQIELLESQINKSKTWKKGLLQKMFV